jgi:hypothetical protein
VPWILIHLPLLISRGFRIGHDHWVCALPHVIYVRLRFEPVGICQWTLGGGPNHPIYIDAVRRVVNATRYIENYISDIPSKVDALQRTQPPNWHKEVKQLQASAESGIGILSV